MNSHPFTIFNDFKPPPFKMRGLPTMCAYSYIGETGLKFTTRLKEHKKKVDRLESKNKNFTLQARKQSFGEQSKLAIPDHALQNNHIINWDDAKVLQMESDSSARYIRESIWIRKRGTNVMNRDEGAYFLSHVYDPLLTSLDNCKTRSRMQRRKSL